MEVKDLKSNSAAIAEGQWVGDIPDMGNLRVLVRGLSSPAVASARARKERIAPRKDRNRDGSLKTAVALQIAAEVLHESVLLDWDGITNEGKPVPYDVKLAKQWLTDPDYKDFANAVAWASMVVDRGEADQIDDIAGN